MRQSRRLTTLWAFTACYRDSFTLFFYTFILRGYNKLSAKASNFIFSQTPKLIHYVMLRSLLLTSTAFVWNVFRQCRCLFNIRNLEGKVISDIDVQWITYSRTGFVFGTETRNNAYSSRVGLHFPTFVFYWRRIYVALTCSLGWSGSKPSILTLALVHCSSTVLR
jgi:hypothetical protein